MMRPPIRSSSEVETPGRTAFFIASNMRWTTAPAARIPATSSGGSIDIRTSTPRLLVILSHYGHSGSRKASQQWSRKLRKPPDPQLAPTTSSPAVWLVLRLLIPRSARLSVTIAVGLGVTRHARKFKTLDRTVLRGVCRRRATEIWFWSARIRADEDNCATISAVPARRGGGCWRRHRSIFLLACFPWL